MAKQKLEPQITKALLSLMQIATSLKVCAAVGKPMTAEVMEEMAEKVEESLQVIQLTIRKASRVLSEGIAEESE